METDFVKCSCGEPLDEAMGLLLEQRSPCPKCGSRNRMFGKGLTETLTMSASLAGVQRRPGFPGGSRVVRFIEGIVPSFKYGHVQKSQRIDRLADTYIEHVELEDGTVVHHVEEPLSKHTDHGSDKK